MASQAITSIAKDSPACKAGRPEFRCPESPTALVRARSSAIVHAAGLIGSYRACDLAALAARIGLLDISSAAWVAKADTGELRSRFLPVSPGVRVQLDWVK
jgi:hypothetical protein